MRSTSTTITARADSGGRCWQGRRRVRRSARRLQHRLAGAVQPVDARRALEGTQHHRRAVLTQVRDRLVAAAADIEVADLARSEDAQRSGRPFGETLTRPSRLSGAVATKNIGCFEIHAAPPLVDDVVRAPHIEDGSAPRAVPPSGATRAETSSVSARAIRSVALSSAARWAKPTRMPTGRGVLSSAAVNLPEAPAGLLQRDLRHRAQELIAPEPDDEVVGAQVRLDLVHDALQHRSPAG